MPIHDWTRVDDGTFHDFHQAWAVELRNALNGGVLPENYYAQIERAAGRDMIPDVVTLTENRGDEADQGGIAVRTAPPRVSKSASSDRQNYLARKSRVTVRRAGVNRIVAFLEIVSPGNKHSQQKFNQFVDKALSALDSGINLLIIDLFPPTPRDPHGIHAAIWGELESNGIDFDPSQPLTAAAYQAGNTVKTYYDSLAVGMALPDMPLFLSSERYVNTPLESTYLAAYRGVPRQFRTMLEAQN